MPSCGNPEKSAGLRFSLIFPTAAPTNAPFICHRQRSRLLPGTRFWSGTRSYEPRVDFYKDSSQI